MSPSAARCTSGRTATRCPSWTCRIDLTSACSRTVAAQRSIPSYGTYFVPTNGGDVGAIVDCSPTTLSQHGPSIEGINVINEAGLSGIGGFTIVNCNGYRIARCGVKYATLTGFEFRYGRESGEDHAWQHVEDYWAYQCKIGFHCDQLLGMRAYSGRIDTVDGGVGMLWTGFPQNMFFFGLFIDGQNAAGVAKGTGILVHESGAHDNHIIGYKLEACGIGAEYPQRPRAGHQPHHLHRRRGLGRR